MTFKDIAKQLTTAVQTVPNLVQILRDGFEQAEAGSGSSIEYSTTERLIGKWIDGSDMYEKTYSFKTDSSSTTTAYAFTDSINKIVNAVGIIDRGDNVFVPISSARYEGATNELIGYLINTSAKNIYIFVNDNSFKNKDAYVTLRYTKPTA